MSFNNIADAGCSGLRYCKSANLGAEKAEVIETITLLAPQYGVPTWFALRIADVESDFNPAARGQAGEYGVYQIKCDTAKLMGFAGDCDKLGNAWTNIRFGLKHLSLAMKRAKGDLKLAASKHNGGLARRTLVRSYVAEVFANGGRG